MWYQGYADPYSRPFNERIWKKAGQYCDVFANNGYADFASAEATYQHSSRVFQNAKKPFIVTEHSYLANDSYFKDQPGWLPTQMDRGNAYADHIKKLLDISVADDPNDPGNPAKTCMGQHWFQLYDEPSLGRPDGEAAQFGVLNAQDEAFLPFVEAAKTVNSQIYDYTINLTSFDIPSAPSAVSPANGSSVQTSTPTFTWTYGGSAASYTLLMSPVASFPEDQTIRAPGITGTSYTPTVPLAQGTWYWTVKAVNAAGHEGKYLSTVRFDIGGLSGADLDPTACLRCERLSGWRNVSNADIGGDGYSFAFLDRSIKTEGQSSLRAAITTNSFNKVTNARSTATADIPFRYGDCGLDYSGASSLTFDIYPKRFCDTTSAIVPSTKYVRFRMVDLGGNVAADQAVDPSGTLPIGQWSTITVPLSGNRSQVSRLEFYVRMSADKLVWDERVNFNIDNLTVAPIADLTPPIPPAIDARPYTLDGTISASLASSDPETGIAEYLYSVGTSPGASDLVGWQSNGASSDVHVSGVPLSDGQVCYLSAKAVNGFGLVSDVGTSAAIRKVSLVPGALEARTRPQGSWIAIQGQVVTARFPDKFYVEHPDRCSGIGVVGASQVSVGDVVTVFGQTQILGHEVVVSGGAADIVSGSALRPAAMNNLATGGAGIGIQESPVDDASTNRLASGLSNLGCLVRLFGKARYVDTWGAFFYVDDGSRLSDGSGWTGVRVSSDGLPLPLLNTFCRVSGVMSVTDVGGKCARQIRARAASDVGYEETAPALANPGFETGTLADWTSYGSVDGVQTGTWFGGITPHSGSFFFGNAANWGTKTGGIYQRVAVHQGYRCTARVWSRVYRSSDNPSTSALNRVGIDPNGGTNPSSSAIKWSAWDQQTTPNYSIWRALASPTLPCASGYVTVFLDFKQQNSAGWHINCFDDAMLNGEKQ